MMKTTKPLPEQKLLISLFQYTPETGVVVRRVSVASNAQKGDVVGTLTDKGYLEVAVNSNIYMLHRIVWRLVTGEDPGKLEIDHRDTVRNNNRWLNLRLSGFDENQRNRNLQKNNTSGIKGVSWNGTKKKWIAQIRAGGRKIQVGSFISAIEAEDAIKDFRSDQHKQFTNHGK